MVNGEKKVMTWYYAKDGREEGPISASELEALIDRGVLDEKSLVWRDGMQEWKRLSFIPEFQHKLRPEELGESGEEIFAEVDVHAISKQVQAAPQMYPLPPSSTLPILSLVFSCLGMMLFCISCLSIPLSIASVVCGHIGYLNAVNEPEKYSGRELAVAGLVIGYIVLFSRALAILTGFF